MSASLATLNMVIRWIVILAAVVCIFREDGLTMALEMRIDREKGIRGDI